MPSCADGNLTSLEGAMVGIGRDMSFRRDLAFPQHRNIPAYLCNDAFAF